MSRLITAAGRRIGTILAALVLVTSAAMAGDISRETARELRNAGVILALESILDKVRERYPDARLLEADLEQDDGIYIYELEILTREGRVRELEVDAASARIIDDEED